MVFMNELVDLIGNLLLLRSSVKKPWIKNIISSICLSSLLVVYDWFLINNVFSHRSNTILFILSFILIPLQLPVILIFLIISILFPGINNNIILWGILIYILLLIYLFLLETYLESRRNKSKKNIINKSAFPVTKDVGGYST